ncbi:MAG: aspartate carbamoyltransferase [Candidatus Bathyarchaeia archaeon]
MSLTGRDLVSVLDFDKRELETIFRTADSMQRFTRKCRSQLKNNVMATIFFEPSTRTRLSFETAMHRLGGSVVGFAEPGISSVAKGETLADTIRMIESYSDVIVLRHKIEGSAKFAAEIAGVPVLNGGDGSQHHPSQTLTDLYTIRREFGKIDGCNILLMGDLNHTRSASSLAYGLGHYKGITLSLVSPESLRMRPEVTDYLDRKGVKYEVGEDPSNFIDEADVIYVTRLQKERFSDPEQAEALKASYVLTKDLLKHATEHAIVLHHLPRIEEIPLEIDYTPNARYFEQAANGVPVRMAFLYLSVYRSKYLPVKKRQPTSNTGGMRRCANPNCISNQPREPILPVMNEVTSKGEQVFQCGYCGRYTK